MISPSSISPGSGITLRLSTLTLDTLAALGAVGVVKHLRGICRAAEEPEAEAMADRAIAVRKSGRRGFIAAGGLLSLLFCSGGLTG